MIDEATCVVIYYVIKHVALTKVKVVHVNAS